jgi:hypothetical protein
VRRRRETLLGTFRIPGEDIERQLQRLDRGELERRNRQDIRARAEAIEDLKGKEEDGVGNLGEVRWCHNDRRSGERSGTKGDTRTTESQF